MSKHHEVPTHLNVEDKLLFGLSARQCLYMLVGSSASYTLWDQAISLHAALRVGLVACILVISLAFALLRPGGRSLEEWLAAALVYAASPRRSTWQPVEPDAADWHPLGVGWQELAPALSWTEDETGCV